MKNIKYIALMLALVLAGCNKWLDVKPRGESSEKEKFSTERGFQSALVGVYTQMANSDLYGYNTTMAVPEFITQMWIDEYAGSNKQDWRSDLVNFKYTNLAKSKIETIFLNYYKCIAQLNVVIRNMEHSDISFDDNHKAMMWGEALGLRAFLHFDLLRFYGPVPAEATSASPTLPYMTFTTVNPSQMTYLTWDNYIKAVETDLAAALDKLKDIDPVLFYNQSEMSPAANENIDKGFSQSTAELNRRRRFNYWAVVATQARVRSWVGDAAGAADLAMKVIEASNPHNNGGEPGLTFNLSNIAEQTSRYLNFTMNNEHIFGLSKPSMQEQLGRIIKGQLVGANPAKPELSQTGDALAGPKCLNTGANPEDVRSRARYWAQFDPAQAVDPIYYYKKYIDVEKGGLNGADLKSTNRIPLIRLAEMYFLVIEGKSVSNASVNKLVEQFCVARNMGQRLWETITDANKMDLLTLEYRKDFIAEGQMFFFFKRLNAKTLDWPGDITVPSGAWVLPRPEMQATYDPYPDMGITPNE